MDRKGLRLNAMGSLRHGKGQGVTGEQMNERLYGLGTARWPGLGA
jgi:hypothetical protein